MRQSFKFLIAFSLFFGSFSCAVYASNGAKANKKERQFLSKWIRSVERDLKWRKGSYCENKRRQEWKPYTYTYTSNEEAERRKRDAEYHKKYYEDHKETRQ